MVQLVKTKLGKKGNARGISISLKKAIGNLLGKKQEKKYSKKQLSGTWPLEEETTVEPTPKPTKKPLAKPRVKKTIVKKPKKKIISKKSKKPVSAKKLSVSKKKGRDKMPSIKNVPMPDVPKTIMENPNKISISEPNIKELKMPSGKLREIIRESGGDELSEDKLALMETRIIGLMQRYNLSETEIEEDIEKLDTDKLLRDFDKLVRLIEHEKSPTHLLFTDEVSGAGVAYGETPKAPETVEKEIKKQQVVTDVDRVLSLVRKNGKIGSSALSKESGIQKKKVEEYAETLSAANLVDLRYPPIGGITLSVKGFFDKKNQRVIKNDC